MRLAVSHLTRYVYENPAHYGVQQLRLTPASNARQRVLEWSVEVEGGRSELAFADQHDNLVTLVSVEAGRREVAVRCAGEVETLDGAGVLGEHQGHAPLWYYLRTTPLTEVGAGVKAIVTRLSTGGGDIAMLHALKELVADRIVYDRSRTMPARSAEAALADGAGVCQDHAHAFVAAARLLGYPARYVSGYLCMDARIDQDAGHAWAEAHVHGLGWVGFDPANGMCPDERYIRVASGLDSREAAPVVGLLLGGGQEALSVSVQVQQQ